jgi:uncharacterized protein
MEFSGYPYPEEMSVSRFMQRVYAWMAFALAVTAGIAYYTFESQTLLKYLSTHYWAMIGLIVGQLVLVMALALYILKMSMTTAITAFVVYAATVGLSLASIFMVYTKTSIYATFGVTAGMFLIMALYGYFTKADLSALGSFMMMALIGLILGGLVNLFLHNSTFDYVLSGIGVVVFTLLTAYDTQKIKQLAQKLWVDRETRGKVAILGALTLYLDFINLFLYMLRFMGQRREN